MTADEIRKEGSDLLKVIGVAEGSYSAIGIAMVGLFTEIAAQLAEMNQRAKAEILRKLPQP